MKRYLKALSLTVGTVAMLGTSALQAAGHRSEPLEIPFDFTVAGKHLPAGQYRLQRGATDRFAALVNVHTGKQVQIMRALGSDGKHTRLIFERHADGYVLRKVS